MAYLIFLLAFCLGLCHPRTSTEDVKHAYVEVRDKVRPTEWAYLIKDAFLELPGTFADSARSDSDGVFKFSILPNPNATYEIRVGLKRIFLNHGLSAGDRIVISDADDLDTILIDRIGANREFSLFEKAIRSAFYYQAYRDTSCTSLDSIKVISRAKVFRSHYPEHDVLCQEVESQANNFLIKELTNVIWWKEVQHGFLRCVSLSDTASTMELGDWYPSDMLDVAHDILEIKANRWYQQGIDTVGADAYLLNKQLQLALQMKGLFRDVCVFEVIKKANQDANQGISLDLAAHLAKEALDTLRMLHGDHRIIKLIDAKLTAITMRHQGTLADNFSLPDSTGSSFSLSQFSGKIVLLHYWGTWCGPCIQTLPETEQLEQHHAADSNLVCINIAVEQDGFRNWKKFLSAHRLCGIQLYAKVDVLRDRSRPAGFQWVQWFPSYILLDRKGRLISADENRPGEGLERDIERAEHD
jgi:thiol-disulfide isomerase/thioredoxin